MAYSVCRPGFINRSLVSAATASCALAAAACSSEPQSEPRAGGRPVEVVRTRADTPARVASTASRPAPVLNSTTTEPPPQRAFVDPPLPPELVDPPGLVPLPPRPTLTDQQGEKP